MSHMISASKSLEPLQHSSIRRLLQFWADRTPRAPAILTPGCPPLTYSRLHEHVDNVVQTLHACGLARHDRVALVLPSGPEMAVTSLAVAAGMTCVPVNPAYSESEFDFYLQALHPQALIIQHDVDSPARAVAQRRDMVVIEVRTFDTVAGLCTPLIEKRIRAPSHEFAEPDDIAFVLHTSGTTARPKIVPLTHTNVCTAASYMRTALALAESDRCLNTVPFLHTYGLVAGILATLTAGASIICPPGFHAAKFFDWMAECRPTWYQAVPAVHQEILVHAKQHRDIIARCPLRYIRSGTALLPPTAREALERVFNTQVLEVWGMVESSGPVTLNAPLSRRRRAGSVGVTLGAEIAIMDEEGSFLPAGNVGEVVLRGPTVMRGYDNDPILNQEVFRKGWLRSGDEGYLDTEGYLHLTGRIKEIINRGGEKIAPQEVDNVLMAHPAVAEAATFAIPHARLIEDIAAAVVLHRNASATASDIRQFAAARLAMFKVPLQIFIVDRIPKHPSSGKLQRHKLAEQLDLMSGHPIPYDRSGIYVPPRTPREESLAELWAQVLHVDRVSIHDNFSQLGGDSILATQLISRVREVMHSNVSFRSFFEDPTVAGMARRLSMANHIALGIHVPASPSVNSDRPLSYAQQRLWFLEQLVPNRGIYNLSRAWRLNGKLNVAALERGLDAIVQRHDILHTTFPSADGRPVQCVTPVPSLTLPVVDLRMLAESAQEAEVWRRINLESQKPFDLAQGPLWRVSLLYLTDETYVFLLNIHHIIFDGWSFDIFFHELTTLYDALCAGKPSPLPSLPLQYHEFARWQHESFQGIGLEAQLAYWKHQLGGSPPLLPLPTDHPRPPVQTFQGKCQSLVLPQHLTQALKALSQQEGVTLFMTLVAAFNILLYRYTGQEDLLVGAPIAGRTQVEIESLIGFFVNTLVLRTDMGGNPSFRELLARVRDVALEAYDHQDLPFEKLVEELMPERSTSHTPLIQVMFALQNASQSVLELPELTLERLEIESGTSKFDLALAMKDTELGLRGEMEYATDLFDDTTITRMLVHFQSLLDGIVNAPDQRIAELPLFTDAARYQMLVGWNDNAVDYPRELCIHQLFQAQVERTPDTVAVVCEGQRLTYRTLNQRANHLAHHLHHLGVEPEVRVGLCMERSLEMVVGMLGILKAGGTYVPLDPATPKERLAFMLADAHMVALVTQQQIVSRLPEHKIHLVCFDTHGECIAQEGSDNFISASVPENLAYVMYTSGSTGEPKGVMVEHRQVLGLLYGFEHVAPDRDPCIGTAVCPMSFDVSVWEIFSALCFGGTLHIIVPDVSTDPERLAHYVLDQHITSAYIPPALLTDVAERLQQHHDRMRLHRILVGVEPIRQSTLQRFRELSRSLRIVNGYGPTETTICATFYPFQEATDSVRRVPIGTNVGGYEVYLVDASMQPVPIGMPGELLVGGVGLARGYNDRTRLTAETFIPHPFSRVGSARLYRTGDLARRLPDGNLEFLGRLDQQVKVRGYRIEPGEIEAALTSLPGVQEAVVVVREVPPDDQRLAAYVVPNPVQESFPALMGEQDTEHVSDWQALFEDIYRQPLPPRAPTFNATGWNSSYTGLSMPTEEMREWVDYTVERLLALCPNRVLEIGCGMGLLLSRLAPHCSTYWGTDFSLEALRYLQQLRRSTRELEHVTLVHRMADNFEGIEARRFDTIILNSVVQYFPSIAYLMGVLDGAMQVVRSGGSIFVGDVRSLPLLEAYHASVQWYRAAPSLSHQQLQLRVQQGIAQERELVIDPAFFLALRKRFSNLGHIQILPKRGRDHNELTRFRYDVILHVGTDGAPMAEPEWLDWQQEGLTLPGVRRLLIEREPKMFGLRGVPDARVEEDLELLKWLANAAAVEPLDHLRETLFSSKKFGIDPEDIWELSAELSYHIDISVADSSRIGCYDVIFRPQSPGAVEDATRPLPFTVEPERVKSLRYYTNDPLQDKVALRLVSYLRNLLREKLPEYMIPSAFIVLDALPLSPHGKVDRQALSAREPVRPLLATTFVVPRTHAERTLASIWAEVLGLDQVGIHDNFFELGGDSILSIQIVAKANQLGLRFVPRQIFQYQTIAELAAVTDTVPVVPAEQELVTGPVLLTPIQQWFFEQDVADPHHWNQARLLEVRQALDMAILERAMQQVCIHHDLLRARFGYKVSGWQQCIAASESNRVYEYIDLSTLSERQQGKIIAHTTEQLQASLSLSGGPLIHAALFDLGPHQPARLLIIVHHLVVDSVSWQILLEDLQTTYEQLCRGQAVRLPPKTTSFKYWAERLRTHAQSDTLRQELPYWLALRHIQPSPVPVDHADGDNTVASARTVSVSLGLDETHALLHDVHRAYRTHVHDVLLTALVQAFVGWTGVSALLIDMEGHGREDIIEGVDLSRTVGWFTTIFPMFLQLEQPSQIADALKSVKEQLRKVPNRGIGYGLLRYLCQDREVREQCQVLPRPDVCFNYLGQLEQGLSQSILFRSAAQSRRQSRSPRGCRQYVLEVNGHLARGQLNVDWTYSHYLHRPATIEKLAQDFIEALRTIIMHCASPSAGGYTPSDFPRMKLNQSELDAIIQSLDGAVEGHSQ